MKQLTYSILLILLVTAAACGQGKINPLKDAMEKFEQFRAKEKFVKDSIIFYPGIAEASMRPILTEKINLAAYDFEKLARTSKVTPLLVSPPTIQLP